jgi:curved DNA-binding protein CbpA
MDERTTLCPRCAALRVLDLGSDASEPSIRTAYRLLIKVWHPDRFQNDPKLKQTAEEKLKEINAAYEFLLSAAGRRIPGQRPRPAEARAASSPPPPRTARAAADVRWNPSFRLDSTMRLVGKFALAAIVILLARYMWIAFNVQNATNESVAKVYEYSANSILPGLEGPKRRFLAAVEQDLERLGLRRLASAPAANLQADHSEAATTESRRAQNAVGAAHPNQAANQPASATIKPYITLGLTKDEVLAIAGEPTASSADKLVYQGSELYLKDGKVSGWKIDPASAPLRVKLWPDGPVDTSLESFTVGSSKNEVLVVQGTPTAFTADRFSYGSSEVYFQNDRVVSWKNDPASIPLRVQAQ